MLTKTIMINVVHYETIFNTKYLIASVLLYYQINF